MATWPQAHLSDLHPRPPQGGLSERKSIALWFQFCPSFITEGLEQWTPAENGLRTMGEGAIGIPQGCFQSIQGLGPTLAPLKSQPQGWIFTI